MRRGGIKLFKTKQTFKSFSTIKQSSSSTILLQQTRNYGSHSGNDHHHKKIQELDQDGLPVLQQWKFPSTETKINQKNRLKLLDQAKNLVYVACVDPNNTEITPKFLELQGRASFNSAEKSSFLILDVNAEPDLANEFQVDFTKLPTLLCFHNGDIIQRILGDKLETHVLYETTKTLNWLLTA